jgi:nucleoside-diphosphate-sugar epimerase
LKICVTGASGFIGKELVAQLTAQGHTINLLTRAGKVSTGHEKYFAANLLDENASLDAFLDDASVIYHCAGEIKDTALMHGLHVDGTKRLLAAVRARINATKQGVHWVQLSSVGAYGPPAGAANELRVVTEETQCKPVGEYEITKTKADELVVEFAKTEPLFTYTILRPSNVVASSMPNQSLRSLVGMVQRRLFFYIGSRTAVATYVHLDDVVAALLLCGTDTRAKGQVFNLSNDCALSDMVGMIAKTSGIKPPNVCVPEWPLRLFVKLTSPLVRTPLTQDRIDALVRHTYYPANKLRDVLGFVPKHDIPAAACHMFDEKLNDQLNK